MKKVKNTNFSPFSDLLFCRLTKKGIEMFVCLHKHNRNLKIDYFYFPIKINCLIYILFSLVTRNIFLLSKKLFTYKSSHRRCSVRKGSLRNFAKFTGITCDRVSFLIKFKKRLWHRCFSVSFPKFLRTPFL